MVTVPLAAVLMTNRSCALLLALVEIHLPRKPLPGPLRFEVELLELRHTGQALSESTGACFTEGIQTEVEPLELRHRGQALSESTGACITDAIIVEVELLELRQELQCSHHRIHIIFADVIRA